MERTDRRLHSGLFQQMDRETEIDQVELSSELTLGSLNSMKKMESRIENLQEDLQIHAGEVEKRTLQRLERSNRRIKSLEKKMDEVVENFQSKWRHLMGKVTEKTITDGRIQALFDRHNHLVHQFENRLSQMQRIIDEQKIQLMNAKDDLSRARREIERLKRL